MRAPLATETQRPSPLLRKMGNAGSSWVWDLEQIPALPLATAVKWTDGILTVHVGQCSHNKQRAIMKEKIS